MGDEGLWNAGVIRGYEGGLRPYTLESSHVVYFVPYTLFE
jgi:hypothetical protein